MDPILTSAWRLWDAWAVRILVLLSFVLQVILTLFGNHRKYTTSLWISVLVWVAYLKADWVATIALSKIPDAKGNDLWATWATMLLLHLGGTDSITAYSLEDNQLWMRQLMGFVVQMFVAIYVIGMSWKNSWLRSMSLPAFVAGISKYLVRTWALKWVSDKKYIDTIPIDDLGRNYFTGVYNEYVQVLVVAHIHLKAFMKFLKNRGTCNVHRLSMPFPYNDIESRIMWDAVEVKMGLMYDVLYTSTTQVYRKRGMLSRICTLVSTEAVYTSLLIIHDSAQAQLDKKIDWAITWVLIFGALYLEIYAVILTCCSNWTLLWVIKVGKRHRVIRLIERYIRIYNKGRNWSNKMGQFDLLGYWLRVRVRETDVRGLSRKRIRLVLGRIIRSVFGREYEEKWNIYLHKTMIPVRPSVVYNAILDLWDPDSNYRRLFFLHDEDHDGQLRDIWDMLDQSSTFGGAFQAKIMCLHLATTLCYHRETETNDGSEDRKVSKALSDYMMYLLIVNPSLYPIDGSDMFSLNPSLFPNDGSETLVENIDYLDSLIGNTGEVRGTCDHLMTQTHSRAWCEVVQSLVRRLERINEKPRRWEIMKLMWWRMLQTAASDPKIGGIRQKDAHFQGLSQGGELLTFIWFYYSPYVEINRGEDRTGNP